MFDIITAYIMSKVVGGPDSIAANSVGPFYKYIISPFIARHYNKEIEKNMEVVQSEIRTLDDMLIGLNQDLKAARHVNLSTARKELGELKQITNALYMDSGTPDYTRYDSWRDKAIAAKRNASSIKELGAYVRPLHEVVASLRQNPNNFDLQEYSSLRAYLLTIDNTYKQRQENFDAPLRQFEMQHKGTAMAEACKRKRLELADARKAKGNEPEVDTYLGSVKTKLAQCAPEWLPFDYPNGHYLSDSSSWRVKLNDPKKVTAKHSQYFWHSLAMSCEYVAPNKFGTINLHDEAKRARRFTDKYSVKAYVSSKAPEDFVQRVAGHSDPNMSVFLYETEKKQLTFNKESHKAPAFASYFAPEQQPRGIRDAIGLFAKGDVIAEDTLKARLGLPEEEIVQLENRDLLFFSSKPGFYSLNNPISKYSPDGGAA